jgi:hypothetical protein
MYRVAEHTFSKSPTRNFRTVHRNESPPSPLSYNYDSEAERMIQQQHLESRQQYQEILHYQIQEKEFEKQQRLQRIPTELENVFARGKFKPQNYF